MIEFTILLDDSDLHFEPLRAESDLAFILPPTARIGRDDDVVHLAPVPVHCFFNAITFGHWLATEHSLSENDAFGVYVIHDMFKGLLRQTPKWDGKRRWIHQREFFDPLVGSLKTERVFDDFAPSFRVAKFHGMADEKQVKVNWQEAVEHERAIEAGTEVYWKKRGRKVESNWPIIGLTVRLQSALSNALSIAYVKRLFVESYVEAIRAEYPDVFARFDAVSYEYDFTDPATLTGDTDKDIKTLCQQSQVTLDGRRLVIRTFVGAHGPHWKQDQETKIRLPFWLLLTLREDPISILFPVPTLHGSDGKPADNPNFANRVRQGFHRRLRDLLSSAKVGKSKLAKWSTRVDEIMANIDQTFHLIHTTAFDDATNARSVDGASATATCSMCGSPVPESFICSPVTDMGFSKSNYTDWHLGDADHACALCAISHFKTPDVLEPARKLIFQRKAVYFTASTPSARESSEAPAKWPFFTATGFKPKLEIRSLESLVTLNVVAALYLHNALQRAVHYRDGERDLWLEATFPTGPFSFVGEVAKAKSKAGMPSFLERLYKSLNRSITLLDPLLPMQVEVPFHTLVCLWGVSKGRHYQFKYKPLIVSNEATTLPIVWEGYHFVDRQTLAAIKRLRAFVDTFKHPEVSHRMKLTALASGPEEFVETLIQLGGFNYETVLDRLARLSEGSDTRSYLKQMRDLVVQTPLITEMWG
jgi:hypothetical protein